MALQSDEFDEHDEADFRGSSAQSGARGGSSARAAGAADNESAGGAQGAGARKRGRASHDDDPVVLLDITTDGDEDNGDNAGARAHVHMHGDKRDDKAGSAERVHVWQWGTGLGEGFFGKRSGRNGRSDQGGAGTPSGTRDGGGTGNGHDDSAPYAHEQSRPRKKHRMMLGIVLGVLALIVLGVLAASRFITDVMWYDQLGFASVLWTQVLTRFGLWLAYPLALCLVALVAVSLASRAATPQTEPQERSHERARGWNLVMQGSSPRTLKRLRWLVVAVALVIGAVFGEQFNQHWPQILLLFNAQPFGVNDPQFGFDIGFYVFMLPGLQLILAAIIVLLLVGAACALVTLLIVGGIRFTLPTRGRGIFAIAKRARRQLALWLLLIMAAWALDQVLDMFGQLTDQGSKITGASYTAVHATIPVMAFMAGVTLLLGVVLALWLLRSHALIEPTPLKVRAMVALRAWRTPVTAIAAALAFALITSVIYPALLQRFKVNPNAQEMESAYIQRNIAATQRAYGLNNVQVEQYQATTQGKSGALAAKAESTAQIRLLDPQVVSPTFKQLQQSKQYYTFADTLAVDKYDIDGESQDTVIAARELDLAGNDNRNWVNDHTVYTHGYGVVAAYGNKVTPDGQPEFFEYGIPTQGKLTQQEHYEPRIYFSPNAPEYSIVGAPQGTPSWEFDYPTGSQGATNTFQGNAGPRVGNLFARLLYALRFQSDQILFSDRVTADSQILYNRKPQARVAAVAPYLTLDGRVYPAVVNGRVKWIVDGYTTTNEYPYAQMTDLGSATVDSTTMTSKTIHGLQSQQANYIRNAVKATVDAYDGSVDLYVWDKSDPIIRAWQRIFPGHYHDVSEMSGELISHMRYPESLFKVQRKLLAQYHVTSAGQFFSGEDFWQTPVDPTESQTAQNSDILQPPYYLTLQTGGSKEPVFSLTSTYIPAGASTREILTGFLSVDSDAGKEKGVIGSHYGTIRLQELPKDLNVPGPGQAQNNFNANADVSKELNLLESGSTNVKRGNLLTLPLGGGLVYVEPVYVQSNGSTSFPLLKKVLVAFGDQVGFANTLNEALNQIFGGNSGAQAGDARNMTAAGAADAASAGSPAQQGAQQQGAQQTTQQSGQQGGQPSSQASAPTQPGTEPGTASKASPALTPALQAALHDAAQAMKDADAARQAGDWAAYGKAQQALRDAVGKAVELSK